MPLPFPVFELLVLPLKGRASTHAMFVELTTAVVPTGAHRTTRCVTAECVTFDEISEDIDRLIEQLNALKTEAKRRFSELAEGKSPHIKEIE